MYKVWYVGDSVGCFYVGDKMGNVFVSLLLDFWFGSGVMGVRVIGIIELIE